MKIRRDEGMLNVFTSVSNIFHNGIIREFIVRSSISLSIFFSEGQNLNFSSFSLTRYKSLFLLQARSAAAVA